MMTEDWQRRSGAIVLVGIAVLLLLLTGRLLYINSVLGPRLRMLAAKQHGGELVIPARRGTIYDCRGRVLATSRQQPDVFVDPLYVDDVDSLAGELGARLALPTSDIAGKIRSRSRHRFVVIARGVDDATTESISSLRSPAVGLVDRAVRAYPLGESLAPVLGIVGRDGHGLEGIELLHDKHLNGHDGRRSTVVDARRRALRQAQEGGTSPIDGGHVVLTIDAEIQRITFEALKEGVADFEAQSGLAVVTSPGNGHVLAMVNVSSRDSSATIATRAPPRRNRVVTDPVEPGSTFKPFVACGALEGGFVTTEELIDCGMGSHRFGKRVVSDVSPHGMLSVLEIVSKSSNIGMAKIAERMGNEALYDIIRRFGFGQPTRIGFPGEGAGVVHSLGHWTTYSTTSVSFGYEVGVTPLQLAAAFSAIVNDGVLVRPVLVARLLDAAGRTIRSFDTPEIVRRVVSSDVARYMSHEVLPAVVERGSGSRARLKGYSVLGKTGTAKVPYRNRSGYEPGAYVATFIGAAPVEDPRVVVLAMIRRPNPSLGYYGGTVAAPVVREILRAALPYLGVASRELIAARIDDQRVGEH